MKITVLIENTGPEGLVHEHGLSLWIEYRGHAILLDGGATGRALDNAGALGIPLRQTELAVLSHGHYDHGDGLPALLGETAAPVFLRPGALEPHWFGEPDVSRYIGLSPEAKEAVTARPRYVEEPTEALPGVWLVPDGVDHEQSLVLETAAGLVVCNSCCHAGAGFILRDLRRTFSGRRVTALIGGMHLMGGEGPRTLGVAPGIVKNLGRWLFEELELDTLYTGHCTGIPGLALLEEDWPRRVVRLTTGMTISFPD